jgi:putative tricarboxylic transport membrane protein
MKKLVPYILFAAAVDALAIVFYVDTLRMPRAAYQMPRIFIGIDGNGPPENNDDLPSEEISPVRAAGFVLLIFGYIMTINPLGYFIATPSFLVATLLFLRSTKPQWIAAIAVGFTGFVYLLFVLFLHMPVPMGLLD